MNLSIILILPLLLSGTILWRMRQKKDQVGCLLGGYITLLCYVFIIFVISMGQMAIQILSDFIGDSAFRSLWTVSLGDWLLAGGMLLLILLLGAVASSLIGFVITGHHPKICKAIWRMLVSAVLLPLAMLAVMGCSLGCAYVICMRIASSMYDDMAWGWTIALFIISGVTLMAFVAWVNYVLSDHQSKLAVYAEDDSTFRCLNENTQYIIPPTEGESVPKEKKEMHMRSPFRKHLVQWFLFLFMIGCCIYCGVDEKLAAPPSSKVENVNVSGWEVETVPNPKKQNAHNWVSNPDHILSESAENEINGMLKKLEDSLTIEIAVVALNSINGEEPRDFAHRLFNTWGVGKAGDDNGLLILLTLDIRDITFETGYGLEGILPDATCKRIQTGAMLPFLSQNKWNEGLVEGVKAVIARLDGSDYVAAPVEPWVVQFYHKTPSLVFVIFVLMLVLMNYQLWSLSISRLLPKDTSANAALTALATYKKISLGSLLKLIWLIPLWPALLAFVVYYWIVLRVQIVRHSHTCMHCGDETLQLIPLEEVSQTTQILTPSDLAELKLTTAYIRVYKCTSCGEMLKVRIELERGYKRCSCCHAITLARMEEDRTIKESTFTSDGFKEAEHQCQNCGSRYIVSHVIPRKSTSSNSRGGFGGSGRGGGGGGSFGGGSSGGGGSSSRF